MEMPVAQRRRGTAGIYYLLLLLAGINLCFGLYGGFVLLKIRDVTQSLPQPRRTTAGDLEAERRVQGGRIAKFLKEAESRYAATRMGARPPPDPQESSKPSAEKTEAPKSSTPDANPPSTPPADLSQQPKQSVKRPEPRETTRLFALPPAESPFSLLDVKFEISNLRSDLQNLSNKISSIPSANRPLFNYVAEQIAAIHIQNRTAESRIAVMEYAIRQMQEQSLVFWLSALGNAVAALQGLVTLYEFTRSKSEKRQATVAF